MIFFIAISFFDIILKSKLKQSRNIQTECLIKNSISREKQIIAVPHNEKQVLL